MSAYGDDAALNVYYRAFEIAEPNTLDPDPDRDGYRPEVTMRGATMSFRFHSWPPRAPQEPQDAPTALDARLVLRERDDLKRALRDALATNRDQAARLREAVVTNRVLWAALIFIIVLFFLFAMRG